MEDPITYPLIKAIELIIPISYNENDGFQFSNMINCMLWLSAPELENKKLHVPKFLQEPR
jgi:hypothetical protein